MLTPPRRKLFTDKWLQSRKPLKPDDAEYRKAIWDTATPGLCIRQGTRVTLYVAKRPPNSSKFVWIKLGDYPTLPLAEARSRARETVAAIVDNKPVPRPASNTVSFGDVVEQFIQTRLPFTAKGHKKRTAAAEEQALRRELPRALLDRPARTIGREDIAKLLTDLAERSARRDNGRLKAGGPHAVRKLRASLSSLFSWAAFPGRNIGGITANPLVTIPAKELLYGLQHNDRRDRVLENAELRTIWQAAELTPYPFGPLIRALILTGQRLNEIASARWLEISEDGATLLIPAERMKNRQAHAVPLTGRTQTLLAELPPFAGDAFIFTTTGGKRPISGFSKMKARFDRTVAAISHVEPWQLHDLRRSVRTGLSEAGILPFHAELVIGHQQTGVHGVYDLFRYQGEKLDALGKWEDLLFDKILAPARQLAAAS
jgi:integrase